MKQLYHLKGLLNDVAILFSARIIIIILIIIIIIIIPRTIFIVLSIWCQPYVRVHFGSPGRKSVSARWLPTLRPVCKVQT